MYTRGVYWKVNPFHRTGRQLILPKQRDPRFITVRRGEVSMTQARTAAGRAMGAARDLRGPAREAAYAAGQAAAVVHVAAYTYDQRGGFNTRQVSRAAIKNDIPNTGHS